MPIDYRGGLDDAREFFVSEVPADPQLRESASIWVSDTEGVINLPRIGIEKIGANWLSPDFQVNVGFPDGRAVVARRSGLGETPVDEDGVCRRMRAGALEFRCVEPFSTWEVTYEGEAHDTTAAHLSRDGLGDAPTVDLAVHVEATMAAPPWVPGTLLAEAAEMMSNDIEGQFISDRYEQLVHTRGTVRVGKEEYSFTGTGLRIRRTGVRNVGGFWGHCWQSALFPSGRGFGFLTFPPRPDGEPSYNEGYVFDGERLAPATVVRAPFLSRRTPVGEDTSLVLRTAEGDVEIRGTNTFSTFVAPGQNAEFAPLLHQAGCHYSWGDEDTYGMMERSIPADQLRD